MSILKYLCLMKFSVWIIFILKFTIAEGQSKTVEVRQDVITGPGNRCTSDNKCEKVDRYAVCGGSGTCICQSGFYFMVQERKRDTQPQKQDKNRRRNRRRENRKVKKDGTERVKREIDDEEKSKRDNGSKQRKNDASKGSTKGKKRERKRRPLVPGKCVVVKNLGDPCRDERDCTLAVPGSICHQDVCTCPLGFTNISSPSMEWLLSNASDIAVEDRVDVSIECVPLTYKCNNYSDCLNLGSDVICQDGECRCDLGFTWTDDRLFCRRARIDETECENHSDCSHLPNTTCPSLSTRNNASFCACASRHFLSESGFRCKFWELSASCEADTQCAGSVPGSECSVGGTCTCRQDMNRTTVQFIPTEQKTRCRAIFLRAGPCLDDADCTDLIPNSACVNRVDNGLQDTIKGENNESIKLTCGCAHGYRESPQLDKCVPVNIEEECSSDAECRIANPNSTCSPVGRLGKISICRCADGYAPVFRNQSIMFISTTSDNGTVETESVFDVAVRVAKNRAEANRTKLQCEKRRIGEHWCAHDAECEAAVQHSRCGNCSHLSPATSFCEERCQGGQCSEVKTCVCKEGFKSSNDGSRCEERFLRDTCQTDKQCLHSVPNSVCLQDKCECATGFRAAHVLLCVKLSLGDECTEDAECKAVIGDNSLCNNSQCSCASGYYNMTDENGDSCRRRHIGGACIYDADCTDAVENSECSADRHCRCLPGHAIGLDLYKCRRRELGDYCSYDEDCYEAINSSVCDNKKCICPKAYFPSGPSACRKRVITDICRNSSECEAAVPGSECHRRRRRCQCVHGRIVSEDNTACTIRKLDEHACGRHIDCSKAVKNSVCDNRSRVCVCRDGFAQSENRTDCIKRELNSTCSEPRDCAEIWKGLCLNGSCQCETNYEMDVTNGEKCVPVPANLSQKCHFNEQCQRLDNYSFCDGQRCVCPSTFFLASDALSCQPIPSLVGGACDTDEHCRFVNNSRCDTRRRKNRFGLCRCTTGHFAVVDKSTCHKVPRHLRDYCEDSSHCTQTIANSECSQKACVCQYGFAQATTNTCKQRQPLPTYTPMARESDPPLCNENSCEAWTNSTCEVEHSGTDKEKEPVCRCPRRMARKFNGTDCLDVQTYLLWLHVAEVAGEYDYLPIIYTSDSHQNLSDRIVLSGVSELFKNSSLKSRFVSCEVKELGPLRSRFRRALSSDNSTSSKGLSVFLLVHFTADYLNAMDTKVVLSSILQQLENEQTKGQIGQSRLRVSEPLEASVKVSDYDECNSGANDCCTFANCMNTLGSYMCVCKPGYEDVDGSLHYDTMGRNCTLSTNSPIDWACRDGGCEDDMDMEIAGIVVAFLLIIMIFITYEIVQRKKSFTARMLYAKFGTTKIRNLKQASMRRIREKKQQIKDENKKRREERKAKKEETKKSGKDKKEGDDEEKLKKEEEKKEQAAAKKAKKEEQKKRKKRKGKLLDTEEADGGEQPVTQPPAIEITMTDMSSDQPPSDPYMPSTSGASPDYNYPSTSDEPRVTTDTSGLPVNNFYPVASPAIAQPWKVLDSDESPV